MGRLDGKVVFLTGTAGGQGRAAALLFAKEGARVVGCDVKDEEALETVELVREAGGKMESFSPVDLSDYAAAGRWIEAGLTKSGGRIDVLYNNASVPRMSFLGQISPEDWSFTIRNELDIIFNAVNQVWKHFLKQRGGVIINTASVAGHKGYADIGESAHVAAKGGVIALTRQVAAEGAKFGIRANSISPGGVMTPALGVLTEEQRSKFHQMHPIGRAGKAEDIAYCALYLASDESSWVTGSDFVVDGGLSAVHGHRF